MQTSSLTSKLQEYTPKSLVCLKEGYTKQKLLGDLFAGVTVGIIALPLAMAFALGSGVDPERGLFTAIIAGFLISLLGGSRVQIGGPTGAFVVIVYNVVQRFGYEGLVIATFMAGVMLVLMGIARFGFFLRFIPYPVTTGFTTGIAVVIFSSQFKDFFGLDMAGVPADFVEKWSAYARHLPSWNPWAAAIAAGALALICIQRRLYPKLPGTIGAVLLSTWAVWCFDLPVDTVETKYGGIPNMLPTPVLPSFSLEQIQLLFPDAIAIALLGAIESLLSAVVADGMTGQRHRSNCELVAQGFANIASSVFGGIPATGAIARTSTNISMGAKTPLAGMLHAAILMLVMLLFAPVASKIPLAALASVLVFVAWNMSELDHFFSIMKGPWSDTIVLLITFFLTIFIDLTVAVQVGVLLAAVLFLKKMTDSTTIKICKEIILEESSPERDPGDADILLRSDTPRGTSVFEINGPFFYGVSDLLNEQLRRLTVVPKTFILRLHKVPLIDVSGIHSLELFQEKCRCRGIVFILCEVTPSVMKSLQTAGVIDLIGRERVFQSFDDALAAAIRDTP